MKIKITENQLKVLLNESDGDIFIKGYKVKDSNLERGELGEIEVQLSNGEKIVGTTNNMCGDDSTDNLDYCGMDCIRVNCVIEFKYGGTSYTVDHSSYKKCWEDGSKPYLKYFINH